jgi:hypothetical protein
MIIKFNRDRKDGACEYMQNGTNGDREKKDHRVQLTDWTCEESINYVNEYLKKTGKWDKYRDNYKHIVLSFNKDNLDKQTMQQIVNDFIRMYMHPYNPTEYVYYAEAHLPKIKQNSNGEERRGHIHIFIHKYSIELDRRLRFLTHPKRRKEINLIKHYLIKKYNLNYTFRYKAISKSNLDFYTAKNIRTAKQLKQLITNYIESNLQNFTSFSHMIKQIEKTFNVKIKTSKNAKTPYISISHKDLKKNIRLKGLLFAESSWERAREQMLNNLENKKYDEEYFLSLQEIEEQLAERQQLLKQEVEQKFGKVREYVAKKKQAMQLQVSLRQLNKIMYKLHLLNTALNVNLSVLKEMENVGVFRGDKGIRLAGKNGSVDINMLVENGDFVAEARGADTQTEAKILAGILADKIKRGEINKDDLVIMGTAEFRLYVNKYLTEALEKEKNIIKRTQRQAERQQTNNLSPSAPSTSAPRENPSARKSKSKKTKNIIDF